MLRATYNWDSYWDYMPLILTFDPNLLGHPSIGDAAGKKRDGIEINISYNNGIITWFKRTYI